MSYANLSHRRTHNILLISRLLNQREGTSPFTLLLDSLEQSAKPLLKEYIRRASLSKIHTIFLAFETPAPPRGVDTFVTCWNKTIQQISQAVAAAVTAHSKRCLLLIDSLASLCNMCSDAASSHDITAVLMSLLQPPSPASQSAPSMVAVYHADLPLHAHAKPYIPSTLSLLEYLATTIITLHSLPILLAEKQAQARSLGTPSFGLAEHKDGLLVGLKARMESSPAESWGSVLQLEHRRKSGRGVFEWYFLPERASSRAQGLPQTTFKEAVSLLDDHPLFKKVDETAQAADQDLAGVTFELGLTERQRLERDGVVLPYFDAQKTGGGGEGGRILYDMGVEDDFDEEEDEI